MKLFSIMTSASEYVTDVQGNGAAAITGSNVNEAKRWPEAEARAVLRVIKAKWDNGAEMFENPEVTK